MPCSTAVLTFFLQGYRDCAGDFESEVKRDHAGGRKRKRRRRIVLLSNKERGGGREERREERTGNRGHADQRIQCFPSLRDLKSVLCKYKPDWTFTVRSRRLHVPRT